ncbi:MAG: hypothetical protein LC792_25205, partial [Actinobacteria bacterium]|nr:hypothetical protein [Actinomycetota bacterium]
TKDCTALSDSELSDMADISAAGSAGYDVGVVSKARDEWVLVTQAYEDDKLAGFAFCTLERIGGTPCVLIGMASVRRGPGSDAVLDGIRGDELRRAVLAFPDEDVLVATRLATPAGYALFGPLEDVVPRPGHKPTGEERAWGRRLAKRFGAEGRVNDRTFVVEGNGDIPGILDYENGAPDEAVVPFFEGFDRERGDTLIVFGWAMAEDLAPLATR